MLSATMRCGIRTRLFVFGVLWGLVLTVVPAVIVFENPFAVSPFLVAAHLCAASSGAVGALLAGGVADDLPGGLLAALGIGALFALVTAPLAALSIWASLTINISGFSLENGKEVAKFLDVLREPGLWVQSSVAAVAVLVYAAVVGLMLAPVTGVVILRISRSGIGRLGV